MLHIYAHANNTPLPGIQPGRTCRVGASIVAGGCHVGARGLGMLGSDIIAAAGTGEHGAGLLANDSLSSDREYRLVVRNSTFAAGALVVQEDGAVDFTAAGTAVYDLYESGQLVPDGPWAISAGFAPPQYVAALPALAAPRTMPALAGSYVAPQFAGALPSMQAARNMPTVAGVYAPPGAAGVLPAMQVLVAMPAIAGSYAVPGSTGVLPDMQVARTMPPVAASYATPTYSLSLPAMQATRSMPALDGLYSGTAWLGVLAATQQVCTMPAIAAAYASPAYEGGVQPMLRVVTMEAIVGDYTAPSALPQATPGYATQEDMRVRFGQTEIVQLTDRSPTAAEVDTDVMSRALLDADAEINMRLHGRYELPLANVPRVLVNVACDIARWRLMEDRATDQVTRRYEEALRLLDKIASGKLALGLEAGESRLKAAGGPAVVGGTRVFSRGRLADYHRDN